MAAEKSDQISEYCFNAKSKSLDESEEEISAPQKEKQDPMMEIKDHGDFENTVEIPKLQATVPGQKMCYEVFQMLCKYWMNCYFNQKFLAEHQRKLRGLNETDLWWNQKGDLFFKCALISSRFLKAFDIIQDGDTVIFKAGEFKMSIKKKNLVDEIPLKKFDQLRGVEQKDKSAEFRKFSVHAGFFDGNVCEIKESLLNDKTRVLHLDLGNGCLPKFTELGIQKNNQVCVLRCLQAFGNSYDVDAKKIHNMLDAFHALFPNLKRIDLWDLREEICDCLTVFTYVDEVMNDPSINQKLKKYGILLVYSKKYIINYSINDVHTIRFIKHLEGEEEAEPQPMDYKDVPEKLNLTPRITQESFIPFISIDFVKNVQVE